MYKTFNVYGSNWLVEIKVMIMYTKSLSYRQTYREHFFRMLLRESKFWEAVLDQKLFHLWVSVYKKLYRDLQFHLLQARPRLCTKFILRLAQVWVCFIKPGNLINSLFPKLNIFLEKGAYNQLASITHTSSYCNKGLSLRTAY